MSGASPNRSIAASYNTGTIQLQSSQHMAAHRSRRKDRSIVFARWRQWLKLHYFDSLRICYATNRMPTTNRLHINALGTTDISKSTTSLQ